jgi:hypothetical protein
MDPHDVLYGGEANKNSVAQAIMHFFKDEVKCAIYNHK